MSRPLRADARRNRALLLDAAEAVFATRGLSTPTEEVARAAGVGVGTLFRHFPTKEALLQAVYQARLRRMADAIRDLDTVDDPGAALFGYLAEAVADSGTKIALADALTDAGIDVRTASAEEARDLARGLTALLDRAQRAGAVRADIGLPELTALLVGASRAVQHAGTDEVRGRIVTVILDGLRPDRTVPPAPV